MTKKMLLVDFENVQQVDFSILDNTFNVIIYVGSNQKNVSLEIILSAKKFGIPIEWQQIEGSGSNALDFHIAMQLGRIIESSPDIECVVLSKDKGFDSLIRHLNKTGLNCKRLNSLLELDSKVVIPDDPNYQRALELLRKIDKKNLPRRRKTLNQHVSAMFQKKLAQPEIDKIIDILFANKLISETNNIISYTL
ncbi:MAG TPA: PIN domain-containing protein [Methylophilus sp.]